MSEGIIDTNTLGGFRVLVRNNGIIKDPLETCITEDLTIDNGRVSNIVPTKWPHVEANLSRASAIQVFWSLESKFANSS